MHTILDKIHQDMECFFRPYFNSREEMLNFYNEIAAYDNSDRIPRQMMNQIYNFITLANDIEKIRPARDSLKIMFLKTCLESLAKLSDRKGKDKAKFYTDFANYISDEGQNYIMKNFEVFSFQDTYKGVVFEPSYQLTVVDFFELIKVVRDKVVHDGNYWEVQFFARDQESTWISSIETEEKFLSYKFHDSTIQKREYHFQTRLNYEEFVYYFVEGCINYVKNYLKERT